MAGVPCQGCDENYMVCYGQNRCISKSEVCRYPHCLHPTMKSYCKECSTISDIIHKGNNYDCLSRLCNYNSGVDKQICSKLLFDTTCQGEIKLCDHKSDCSSKSDEEICTLASYQKSGNLFCQSDRSSLKKDKVCDGETDCKLGEDEENCTICKDLQERKFICPLNSTRCIRHDQVCDEIVDCQADEAICSKCLKHRPIMCPNGTKCLSINDANKAVIECPGNPITIDSPQPQYNVFSHTTNFSSLKVTNDMIVRRITLMEKMNSIVALAHLHIFKMSRFKYQIYP